MTPTSKRQEWLPLIDALEAMAARGDVARFWLRDDDAVEPTPALARLLEPLRAIQAPATLAVIPQHTGPALADMLNGFSQVSVSVHGWSHGNHAPAGEKKQELGPHRPTAAILAELKAGFDTLSALHGARFVPLLTPPWNRIDTSLLPHLGGLGFKAVSVFNDERTGPMREINTQIDVIDWRGSRGGRPTAELVSEILSRLAVTLRSGGMVGVLTHHLVHDDVVLRFLDELLEVTGNHPAASWTDIRTIIGNESSDAA